MKKIIFICLVLPMLFVYGFKSMYVQTTDSPQSCDQKQVKSMMQPMLPPFIVDGFKLTKIMFKNKPQVKEVEIPLFYGENYRIIFLTSQLPLGIGISIYNKAHSAKKRTLMFSSKDVPKSDTLRFETDRAKDFFVEYEIPATDSMRSGCVAFMLGYEEAQ